ncbi:MAG: hypothetical protein HYU68_05595 [Bacteroidetes bacterium]|nr:hypothetical protein [Bacteroidota bacterium]
MKQIATIIFLVIISTTLHAQDNTSIIKKWSLIEIEEFGSKYPKTDVQKDDFFEFTTENKFSGLINGQVVEGTWSDKAAKYILTPNKEKSTFKVNWIKLVSIDKEQLVLNYQSVDLIQTKLFLKPAE